MRKPGRNDPCHCGSGKKYKKCHLESDRLLPWGGRPPQASRASNRPSPAPSPPPAPLDFKTLPDRLRRFAKEGPAKDREKFAELLATMEPILRYFSRQEDVEAAVQALEAHRAAFDELVQDEERYSALVRDVFSEECFAPFRFTASEIQRAFDHVGHPSLILPDDRAVQILRAAILHLADQERRNVLSLGLMSQLPDFVGAGRHLEGWLVQSLAADTADRTEEPNAFLFQMFSFGYDAWVAQKQGKGEAFLRELGIDVDQLRGMKPDDIDSWIQSHSSDPANAGVLEAFFNENPGLREESVADLEAMERKSAELLEREDGHCLLLSNEEVEPWMARFNEDLVRSGFSPPTPDKALSEEEVRQMFEKLMLPIMREMAEGIFTRDRILQLVARLKEFRNDRFAAEDHQTAQLAMGAIRYLEREDSPGLNTFLLALCWRSLHAAINACFPDD